MLVVKLYEKAHSVKADVAAAVCCERQLLSDLRTMLLSAPSVSPQDYERLPQTGVAMIHWAMSRIMLRRLTGATRLKVSRKRSKTAQESDFGYYCKTVSIYCLRKSTVLCSLVSLLGSAIVTSQIEIRI